MADHVPCEAEERQNLAPGGSPENRISLKFINIPKEGGEEGSDKRGGVIMKATLVCSFNSKGLGCTKALKGPRRALLDDHGNWGSDSNKNATSNLKNGSEARSEAMCPVCSKVFQLKKAMYGHMRCHPEREWRGISPRLSAKTGSCSTVWQKNDELSPSAMKSTVVSSDTSPSQPPLRWTNTGRRGQNHIIKLYSTCGSSCNISSLHKGT